MYTIFVRITIPVLSGRLTIDKPFDPVTENMPTPGAGRGELT
jgi:hypothetical protein